VVVRGGLAEGEEVVLNAVAYREKVALPEMLPERRSASVAAAGAAAPKEKAETLPDEKHLKLDDRMALTDAMFRQYDLDGDGKVRLADLPEKLRLRLQAADVDHDGFVERAEWAALASRVMSPTGVLPNSPPKGAVTIDANCR
jgi:hypothetical protein